MNSGEFSSFARREFVLALATGVALPTACSAQAVRPQFTPEAFGAKGDGRTDDYDAMMRMVAAVNAAGGGTVGLAGGRTYFLDRYVTAANQADSLTFKNCSGLTIEGNGAAIAVKGDFFRDQRATSSLAGLVFADCRNVALRRLELVGNVGQTRRDMTLREPSSHGLVFEGCYDVLIDGVTSRHFAADGLYIRQSRQPGPTKVWSASRRFTVRNSRFLFNARQGLSVIQLRGGRFENCDFSHTGYIAPETRGPYGHHNPSAGVDVEPNRSPNTERPVDVMTGDLHFANCRMIGNRGIAFAACKYGPSGRFVEQISVESCLLQCDESDAIRYGFIFDVEGGHVTNCTLRMNGRTAYIGWRRRSDARPRFSSNTVYGRNRGRVSPLVYVRPTNGAPVVEGNRFIITGATGLNAADRRSVMIVGNPNAIVRDNQILAEP